MAGNSKAENALPDSDPFRAGSYRLESCSLQSLETCDIEAVATLLAAVDPWLTLGYSREQLQRYLLRPDPSLRRFSMFANRATPAGILCIRYPWLLGAYIETIAVFGPLQGRGVGRETIEWVSDRIRPESRNLWALVSSFNRPARDFYSRMGFDEIAPLADLVKPGCDEILLRKRI